MLKIAVFTLLISVISLFGEDYKKLSDHQIETLQIIIDTAKQYKDYKGETFPKTMAAICLTESTGGLEESKGRRTIGDIPKDKSLHKSSVGVMQMRVATIRDIARKFKIKKILKMSDRQIAETVLHNRVLSGHLSTMYFIMNKNRFKSYFIAISKYNGGTKNHSYVNKVMKRMKTINKLIEMGKIKV